MSLFSKSPKKPLPNLRKRIHDLRAAQHAATLNVEAAILLAGKLEGKHAEKLERHLALAKKELARLAGELEQLSAALHEA